MQNSHARMATGCPHTAARAAASEARGDALGNRETEHTKRGHAAAARSTPTQRGARVCKRGEHTRNNSSGKRDHPETADLFVLQSRARAPPKGPPKTAHMTALAAVDLHGAHKQASKQESKPKAQSPYFLWRRLHTLELRTGQVSAVPHHERVWVSKCVHGGIFVRTSTCQRGCVAREEDSAAAPA